jgi:putative oxidoreductase
MKIAAMIARYLLGVLFTVFGLNGFLHFIPQPPMPAGPAAQFTSVMAQTHYLVFVFAIQLLCGILFLINRYVILALVLIAPVIVNILLFHITMAPSGLPPGVIATVLWCVLAYRCRAAFTPILQPRVPAD